MKKLILASSLILFVALLAAISLLQNTNSGETEDVNAQIKDNQQDQVRLNTKTVDICFEDTLICDFQIAIPKEWSQLEISAVGNENRYVKFGNETSDITIVASTANDSDHAQPINQLEDLSNTVTKEVEGVTFNIISNLPSSMVEEITRTISYQGDEKLEYVPMETETKTTPIEEEPLLDTI